MRDVPYKGNLRRKLKTSSDNLTREAFMSADAQDEGALLDALERLLPSEADRFTEATAAKPREYIRQLDMIETSVEEKLHAVNTFLVANWIQERWLADRIPEKDIARHREELMKKYNRVWNAYRGLSTDSESEKIKSGRRIFEQTCTSVENLHTAGVPFVPDMNEGELHHKADSRKIGWHPDWERR